MKLLLLFVIVGGVLLVSYFGRPASKEQTEEAAYSEP
jgi:hypothetical protein